MQGQTGFAAVFSWVQPWDDPFGTADRPFAGTALLTTQGRPVHSGRLPPSQPPRNTRGEGSQPRNSWVRKANQPHYSVLARLGAEFSIRRSLLYGPRLAARLAAARLMPRAIAQPTGSPAQRSTRRRWTRTRMANGTPGNRCAGTRWRKTVTPARPARLLRGQRAGWCQGTTFPGRDRGPTKRSDGHACPRSIRSGPEACPDSQRRRRPQGARAACDRPGRPFSRPHGPRPSCVILVRLAACPCMAPPPSSLPLPSSRDLSRSCSVPASPCEGFPTVRTPAPKHPPRRTRTPPIRLQEKPADNRPALPPEIK